MYCLLEMTESEQKEAGVGPFFKKEHKLYREVLLYSWFSWIGFDQARKYLVICTYRNY